MDRRRFTASIAAVAALGAAGTARADYGDRVLAGDARPIRVLRNGQALSVSDLAFATAAGGYGLAAGPTSAVFGEDRVDLGGALGLLRPVFRTRWLQARPVGVAQISGTRLSAALDEGGDLAGMRVTIAAGDYSWDVAGTLRAVGRTAQVVGQDIGAVRLEGAQRVLIRLNATPLV